MCVVFGHIFSILQLRDTEFNNDHRAFENLYIIYLLAQYFANLLHNFIDIYQFDKVGWRVIPDKKN